MTEALRAEIEALPDISLERGFPVWRPAIERAAVLAAFDRLAASPAPDPGAGLREALDDPEVVRLRDAIYDAVSGYEPTLMLVVDLQNAILAALAPSAEPPETTT